MAVRWRSPGTWPLRVRLVAIMITLLAVLGVAVGTTAELYLYKSLYQQLDTKLGEVAKFAAGCGPEANTEPAGADCPPIAGPNGPPLTAAGPQGADSPPPGAEVDWIVVRDVAPGSPGARSNASGIVGLSRSTGRVVLTLSAVPTATRDTLTAVPTGRIVSVPLDGYGPYRVLAVQGADGTTVVAAPLAQLHETLVVVAAYTGGAVLVAVLVAGLAGAVIVRRTLQPLERVAATATRVSELELGRGEVDLAQRVPAADTDPRTEVGQVGAALNRMLDHVGRALEARHASETQVRQFVADASHELRTPLAAIRGYAELSRRSRTPVPEEIRHVLRRVESEAQRMTTLVEDLLLLARLDAGRPLAQEPVDLTMLVVDAVSDAHAAGPRHDWRLDLPDAPVVVAGDSARLHQVLANLLANARTHTPEGTTVIAGVRETHDAVLLQVTDFGPGIPAALQPHVFERFARGDTSRSRAAGSTGLGLSIVHSVVTAHGGTVGVQSVPGRTTFTIRLPLQNPPADGADAVTRPADPSGPPAVSRSGAPSGPPAAAAASHGRSDAVHQHVTQVVQ